MCYRCNRVRGPRLDRIDGFSSYVANYQVSCSSSESQYLLLYNPSAYSSNSRLFEPEMPDLEHVVIPERCEICGGLKSAASSSSKSSSSDSGKSNGAEKMTVRSRSRSSSNCVEACLCETGTSYFFVFLHNAYN